jgi:AmiR/NasT family two-component response regulator
LEGLKVKEEIKVLEAEGQGEALEMKILIGDDEAGMRMILRRAIEKTEGFEIVGEGEDGLSVLSLAEKLKPNVILWMWKCRK